MVMQNNYKLYCFTFIMRKGSRQTEEARRKMSEAKKGKPIPWLKGIKVIPNERQLEALRKGRELSHTKEVYAKIVMIRKMKGNYKQTAEARKKMSLAHKGKHNSPKTEFKKGMIPWMKGRHQTQEAIEKQRTALLKTYSTNPQLRKRVSEATKKAMANPEILRKLSLAHKGKPAWNKGKHTGLIPWTKGKKFPETAERSRATILRMYQSGKFPKQTDTKPEREIKAELIKRGYKEGKDFIHQYKFANKFMCDFCFPENKVIIEVYGDFWHCNPAIYSQPIHPHQIKDINRDKSKEAYITKYDNGSWTYLVIWESDIKKDVSKCVDKIEKILISKKI